MSHVPRSFTAAQKGLFLLCLYHFGSRFASNIFFVTAQSAFFARVGVTALPWIYTAMNVVYISLQVVSLQRLQAHSAVYLRRLALAFAGLGALRIFLFPEPGFGITTFFLLLVMVYELFFMQFFNHWLNDLFPLQEGKRSLPVIQGAGSMSFIASGLFLKITLAFAPIEKLAMIALGLFLAVQALLPIISACFPPPVRKASTGAVSAKDSETAQPAAATPLPTLSEFAKTWCVLGFLTMIGKYWLDYQYSRAITTLYPKEQDLAGFIAIFSATTDALVLLGQMTIAGTLLQRWSLPLILSFLPGVSLLLGAWPLLTGSAWGVLLTQFFFTLIAKALHQSAGSLLLSVVPAAPRLRLMSAAGIAASAGAMSAGLSLLLFQRVLGTSAAFLLLELVFAGMLIMVWHLSKAWRMELVKGMADLDGPTSMGDQALPPGLGFSLDRSDSRSIVLDPGRQHPHDLLLSLSLSGKERRNIIDQLLTGTEAAKLTAIDLATRLPTEETTNILLSLLADSQPARVRASAIRCLAARVATVSGSGSHSLVLDLLSSSDLEPRIRANLIEGLGELSDGTLFIPALRRFLADPDPRVKSAAIVTMLRLGPCEDDLREALTRLSAMFDDAENANQRAAAVAAAGRLQHEAFLPEIVLCLDDSHPSVIRQAILALGRLPIMASRQALSDRLARPFPEGLDHLARSTITSLEQLSLDSVLELADDLTAADRSLLASSPSHADDGPRRNVLLKALTLSQPVVRSIIGKWILETNDAGMLKLFSDILSGSPGSGAFRTGFTHARGLSVPHTIRLLGRLLEGKALDVYDEILTGLWQRLFIGSACRERLLEVDPFFPLLNVTIALEEEFALVSRMTARRCPDHDEIEQALRKGALGDRFAVSLAAEILTPKLPRDLGEIAKRFLRCQAGQETFLDATSALGIGNIAGCSASDLAQLMQERIQANPGFAANLPEEAAER